jgi:uncharacterized protein (DUF2141 family)
MVSASIILLFGAMAYARDVSNFKFSDERFPDGAQGTIYASIKITNDGELNVCKYESTDGQFLGIYQDTNMLFPRNGSVDAGTVKNYCLRTLIVKHGSYSQRLGQWTGLGRRSWPGTPQLLLVSGLRFLLGASGQGNTLTITATGVSNANGVVGVLIFNSPRGWPNDNAHAFRAVAIPSQRGSVTISLPALPSGSYAVVVLHDENQNRRLDRTWFGLPKEQWGMSNNPPVHFSAPNFKQARFTLTHDEKIHVILH